MLKISITVLLLICLSLPGTKGYAGKPYDNNQNIRLAHQQLFALHPVSAEKILKSEELANPNNGYIIFYRMYSELVTLMIANSTEEYKKKASVLNQYLEKLSELPDVGPDFRLLLGEAKVFTGLLRVKYDSKFSGLIECLRGYNLLEENEVRYPSFQPNGKIPGIIQISVAFMPKILQWGIKLLGIKGNPQAGLKRLSDYSKFAEGKPGYEEEALVFTIAAFKLMNQADELTKLIYEKKDHFKDIALINYLTAATSTEANDAEIALQLLSNIENDKLEIPFYPPLYLLGKTKMMRLDPDSNIPLLTYLHQSQANDYLKSTLYALACYNYCFGNIPQYRNYLQQVKEKGRELQTRDIEATFEAAKTELPNRWLLRADFLVTGGYYQKAEEELAKVSNPTVLSEKVLFYFLKGECKRLAKQVKESELAYLKAVESGRDSGDYIAQKALAQAGFMMEKNGFKAEAAKYYNLCRDFKATSNPYSDQYNNKAKAGLIRLAFPD